MRHKLIVVASFILIGSLGLWIYYQRKHDVHPEQTIHAPVPGAQEAISKNDVAKSESAILPDTVEDTHSAIPADRINAKTKPKASVKDDGVAASKAKVDSKLLNDAYVQAEPLKGYPDFYDYLNTNLRYPVESIKDSIQGVETISFTVNAAGKAENIMVRQSLGKPFDTESIRVIQNMSPWKPATLNGVPVASQISIPLTFHLERIK